MLDTDFSEWLRKEGTFIADIEPGTVAEGFRGIIAKSDIEPGLPCPRSPPFRPPRIWTYRMFGIVHICFTTQCPAGALLVSVPERLLLSVHTAKKDAAFSAALSATNKRSTASSQASGLTVCHDVGFCSSRSHASWTLRLANDGRYWRLTCYMRSLKGRTLSGTPTLQLFRASILVCPTSLPRMSRNCRWDVAKQQILAFAGSILFTDILREHDDSYRWHMQWT